ncbi:nitrilase-related carbon-nitrogen hydrolase [Vibrio neonatus]|uniref:nitrilase-related carbon-nitrogen hydrolase n=1 Tax=Vibrio neonatus TaxID=278860 RepID=UPI0021C451DD|nr:nitrilase-related carbon-nitrogen hydrolase [Vibrio neonatus]
MAKNRSRSHPGSHTERQYWSEGEASTIKNVTMQGIQVSAVQCWEARNPLTVSQLALNAPDVVFLPTGDFYNEKFGGLYTVEMRYIGRNVHSYVLSSSIMFNWDSLAKSDKDLMAAWKKFMPPQAPAAGLGGGAAVDPHGKVLDITKPFETRLVTAVVDTDQIEGSLALHSITDSYRLKGDYTLYVDGKKVTGNGVDSIY